MGSRGSRIWLIGVGDECVIFSLGECGIRVEERKIVVLKTETFKAPVLLGSIVRKIGGLIFGAMGVKVRQNLMWVGAGSVESYTVIHSLHSWNVAQLELFLEICHCKKSDISANRVLKREEKHLLVPAVA